MVDHFSIGQKTEVTCGIKNGDILIDSVTSDLQGQILKHHQDIVKMTDDMVKSALVDLGWIPPIDRDKKIELIRDLEEIKRLCDGNSDKENAIWHKANVIIKKLQSITEKGG